METILSIAGKPGLYKMVSRGKMNLIVESLDAKHHRMPAFATDRVTSLADIAMYTDAEDVPLWQVLDNLSKKKRDEWPHSTTRSAQARSCATTSLRCCPTSTRTAFMTATSRSCCSGTISLSNMDIQTSSRFSHPPRATMSTTVKSRSNLR